MFAAFSSGYYLGRLFVQPAPDERAVINRDQHERVNQQLYADDDGITRTDHPLIMKLGSTHLSVHGADDVPEGTLAVPEVVLNAMGVVNPPTLKAVLLAKREHARRLVNIGAVDD